MYSKNFTVIRAVSLAGRLRRATDANGAVAFAAYVIALALVQVA